MEQIAAIKTAVSEAVTNAIVHGYRDTRGTVEMTLRMYSGNLLYISVKDKDRSAVAEQPLNLPQNNWHSIC